MPQRSFTGAVRIERTIEVTAEMRRALEDRGVDVSQREEGVRHFTEVVDREVDELHEIGEKLIDTDAEAKRRLELAEVEGRVEEAERQLSELQDRRRLLREALGQEAVQEAEFVKLPAPPFEPKPEGASEPPEPTHIFDAPKKTEGRR